ncbi:MAG TPA: hypothetical protein GXX31_00925 [Methanothermobacter sp.]|jgi:hypothetical protein|uniref:Uncharacterized protein n=1 Tax=Methanothermobacter tenebrarum TaxID=680118 RepID=A0ABM7YFF6_9EURY|nr:hypothetical protein [Methanothermobacter tenebrarum]MDD3453938.1 hypothetical protein [Methanobacteriales archaeon]MDI6882179.1 hypothetical protein [Methanothermobacter sp.]MDX9692753.1 hypothetical protein [Methanothermobacter sp.]BDH80104.1 hypothetical protein MTTB_14830 [Methanothermobacter tenebrarum]HHW15937.1 hypothetical protein [Methanothermobacter sp.]
MERSYIILSLAMIGILVMVIIAASIMQLRVAILAAIIFTVLVSFFFLGERVEKIETIAFWFIIIMFIITAAFIFKEGGF